jgi:type IV pilus assembly protein PilW
MQLKRRTPSLGGRQRGLSLVELMVGVVVSLFVVAAATLLMSTQMTDNRRLLLETQIQQDLRATADIVAKELRRSSFWGGHASGVPAPAVGTVVANPSRTLSFVSTSNTVNYRYTRTAGATAFGFKLENGIIKSCQGEPDVDGLCGGAYQELTDPKSVTINAFTVTQERSATPNNDDSLILPCPNLCSDSTTNCWPRVAVREFVITLSGTSVADPTVTRELRVGVRVRNDRVDLSTEAVVNQACPVS